ncbi:MAG: hypothetical protein AAF268_14345, partial [Cyanobacteria bacterium P01_A01_bin.3]
AQENTIGCKHTTSSMGIERYSDLQSAMESSLTIPSYESRTLAVSALQTYSGFYSFQQSAK